MPRDLSFDIKARDTTGPAFDSAKRNASGFMRTMEAAESHLRLTATLAKGIAMGVVVEGAAQLLSYSERTVAEFASLQDLSDKIGMSAEDVQRMQFGFTQAGIEAGNVDAMLTKWSKNLGEAASKGNELSKLFEANGISMRNADGSLRSQVEMMGEFANIVQRAGSDQERLTLAMMGFGRSGGEAVNVLRQGTEGVNAMMHAVDEAGGVMENELVARMAVIDDKFAMLERRVSMGLKGAILEAAAGLDTFITKLDGLHSTYTEGRNAVEAGALAGSMVGAPSARRDDQSRVTSGLKSDRPYLLGGYELDRTQKGWSFLHDRDQIALPDSALGVRPGKKPEQYFEGEPIIELRGELARMAYAIKQLESSGGNYQAVGPRTKKGDHGYGAYQVMGVNVGPWTQAAVGRRMTPQEFMDAPWAQDAVFADQFTRNYNNTGSWADAASIWHSGSTLAAAKARGANDGYKATAVYVAQAEALRSGGAGGGRGGYGAAGGADPWGNMRTVEQSAGLLEMNQQLADSYSVLGAIGKTALDGIASALSDGKIEGKEVLQILLQIGQQLLPMLGNLMGSGAPGGGGLLASIFGGGGGLGPLSAGTKKANSFLFGTGLSNFGSGFNPTKGVGLFANGTDAAPAGWAIIGEDGPELLKLTGGEQVRSHERSKQMMRAAGGGKASFNPVYNIDARGATMTPEQFRRIADQSVQSGLAEYHEHMSNAGFGTMQKRYMSEKG